MDRVRFDVGPPRADQRCDHHAPGTRRVDRRMARGRSATAGRRADKFFSLTPVIDPRMGPTLGFGDRPARSAVTSPQTFFFFGTVRERRPTIEALVILFL